MNLGIEEFAKSHLPILVILGRPLMFVLFTEVRLNRDRSQFVFFRPVF